MLGCRAVALPSTEQIVIDGCQVLKGDIRRYSQLWPKVQLCKMAEMRKGKWNPWCHLVVGSLAEGGSTLVLLLCT